MCGEEKNYDWVGLFSEERAFFHGGRKMSLVFWEKGKSTSFRVFWWVGVVSGRDVYRMLCVDLALGSGSVRGW